MMKKLLSLLKRKPATVKVAETAPVNTDRMKYYCMAGKK